MTLVAALKNAAAEDHSAITFVLPNDREEIVSYKELFQNAVRVLGKLQQQGVKAGDEVVIQVEDNRSFLNIFWACLLGKMIPVPLSCSAQVELQHKLFTIWQFLFNPFLICDEQRLLQLEGNTENNVLKEQITAKAIPDGTLIDSDVTGMMVDVLPEDVAYIQFSSGSTGNPKGVCLTHRNLMCNIGDIIESLAITPNDRLLSWMPLTHDMGLIGFHLTGIVRNVPAICLPTALFVRRPLKWMQAASQVRASVLYAPNFGLHYFVSAMNAGMIYPWDLSCVRIIVNGAESISPALCANFTRALMPYGLPAGSMLTAYGLAEASVEVTAMPVNSHVKTYYLNRMYLNTGDTIRMVPAGAAEATAFVDVGFPVRNCQVRICNEDDRPVPEHTIGHIQVKGDNITAGYYNNPDATQAVFTCDRWLRTGDLGFMRGGRLIVTGRYKNIIIINGQNYYPQDIEQVIIDAGLAGRGKVVACGNRDAGSNIEELIVFVLYKGDQIEFESLAAPIRQHVLKQVGIPVSKVIPVTKIPKTTSGKIQHFVLLEQYRNAINKEAPANGIEKNIESGSDAHTVGWKERLTSIIKDLSALDSVHEHTGWMEIGMNSILVMQLASRIQQQTGIQVPIDAFFTYPNIHSLCNYLETASPCPDKMPGFKGGSSDCTDMSVAQKRIWTECFLNPQQVGYNVPVVYTIQGHMNLALLEVALKQLVGRHDILRTSFEMCGDIPQRRIHAAGENNCFIRYIDLRNTAHYVEEAAVIIHNEINKPFLLHELPLFRLVVVQLSHDAYRLVFVIHHIITDGWSLMLLFRELWTAYQSLCSGDTLPVVASPVASFSDYVSWQKEWLRSPFMEMQKKYWQEALQSMPEPVTIADKEVQALHRETIQVQQYIHSFSNDIFKAIKTFAKQYDTTPFTVTMTLLNVLFYRYSNEKDIVTGFDVTGRTEQGLEQVMGYLLNTLCCRVRLHGGQSFAEVLHHVKQQVYLALNNQQYPFEWLLEDPAINRRQGGNGLFGILILYQNFLKETAGSSLTGCVIERESAYPKNGLVDLLFEFFEEGNALTVVINYNKDLYSSVLVHRLVMHLENLVRRVQENDRQKIAFYDLLTVDEKQLMTPDKKTDFFNKHLCVPLHTLFEKRASATPHLPAIDNGEQVLTYQQLNERTNSIARWLRTKYRIQPDDRIGFLVSRNENIVIAMLAILKAGAAYVGIDPEYPETLCDFIVQDSHMCCLLVDADTCRKADGFCAPDFLVNMNEEDLFTGDRSNLACEVTLRHLAYIIYTSGSTGKPKGVMIEHRSLFQYVRQFISYFNISRQDIVIQQSSVSFDTVVEEIFPALCVSGKVVIARNGARDVEELLCLIATKNATILSSTPLVLKEINNYVDSRISTLRLVISGGDVLQQSHIDKLFPNVDIYNTYGPSETTVCATYKKITSLSEVSLIGRPVSSHAVYILDENRMPLPVGRVGDIYIAGGLARGYCNLPELTAEKFIPHPEGNNECIYISGDRGRWTESGDIEFVGRSDFQIKIQGHRVEPAQLENTIIQHPSVESAVAILEKDEQYLTAFLTIKNEFDENAMRLFIGARLPSYMIPYRFEVIDKIPLTVSGKVDRMALQELAASLKRTTDIYAATNSNLEIRLLLVVKSILKIERIGIANNFFEFGCNSIKAAAMVKRIQKEWQCGLSIQDIFMYPTIALLSARIRQSGTMAYEPVRRIDELPCYELSAGQRRLWILSRMDRQTVAYNESELYEVQGPVDTVLVEKTFASLVRYHETLRTTFKDEKGIPRQIVHAANDAVNLFYCDVASAPDPLAAAEDIVKKQTATPFNLETGPLYRIMLIQVAPQHFLLSVIMHHIITDDWSGSLLVKEFFGIYNQLTEGAIPPLTRSGPQYKDYVYWLQKRPEPVAARNYWREVFASGVPVLHLPYDYPRPVVKKNEGDAVCCFFDAALLQQMNAFCNERQMSLFMLLLSGLAVLLARYSGQYDMVIGVPVAGRQHPDADHIIGFFVNTLPLRIRFDAGDDVKELLMKIKQLCLSAFEHQEYDFDDIVRNVYTARDISRSPLFDVLLNFRARDNDFADYDLGPVRFNRMAKKVVSSKYDLSFYVEERENSLSLMLEYDTHLFSKESMVRLSEHYINMVRQMISPYAERVAYIDYLQAEEKKELLYDFNKTAWVSSGATVIDLFLNQVRQAPAQPAVTCNGRTMSYEELDRQSSQLAHLLIEAYGVVRGSIVGLILNRSEKIIIAILAVWKAGATYVPVDPETPADRIAYILNDTETSVIITDAEPVDIISKNSRLIPVLHFSEDPFSTNTTALRQWLHACTGIAYIIYTSGSTGMPKGIAVHHYSVVNILSFLQASPGIQPKETVLSVSNYVFDISVAEFFLPLISGAHLLIATKMEVLDILLLKALIKKTSPAYMQATPSLWQLLVNAGWEGHPQLKLISCGEPLSKELLARLLPLAGGIWNMYGPTETTIFSTGKKLQSLDEPVSIGSPVSNTHIYILDNFRQLVPVGVWGEIYIGGDGVAAGYVNLPQLTRQKFISSTFEYEENLYASGDTGRWLPDGTIELKGRIDGQVKIRGYRIEPAEIENAILKFPDIQLAAVVAHQDANGDKILIAYVVCRKAADLSEEPLKAHLRKILPSYMIPAFIVPLDVMPLNNNGKIDRVQLTARDHLFPTTKTTGEIMLPQNSIEETLMKLWQEILDRRDISITDDFFDIGGHSLKANRLANKIYQQMAVEVNLSDIFKYATIQQQGALIAARQKDQYTYIELS